MATERLSKQQAKDLLPPFVLGLLSDRAYVSHPGPEIWIELPDSGNRTVLHVDDYEFMRLYVVQFFFGRPFKITEEHVRGRINRVWGDPLSASTPTTPGLVSSLENPIELELP